jgi:hypothetical protein
LRDIIRRVNSLFMVFHEEENLLWAWKSGKHNCNCISCKLLLSSI